MSNITEHMQKVGTIWWRYKVMFDGMLLLLPNATCPLRSTTDDCVDQIYAAVGAPAGLPRTEVQMWGTIEAIHPTNFDYEHNA
eukprot:715110-Amphidinium_carterae.1